MTSFGIKMRGTAKCIKNVGSLLTTLFLLTIGGSVFAQFDKWSDVPAGTPVNPVNRPPQAPAAPRGGLTFFTNQATFEGAAPGLALETFSSSLVPANNVCSNNPPLSSATNDSCFAAGDLMAGWNISIVPNGGSGQYVLLTNGFIGAPFNLVGPNSFVEHMDLNFNPPVTAVGFDLVGDLITPVNVDLEIFGVGGVSLGTTNAIGTLGGAFWGVTSGQPIESIAFREASGGGELIGNMQYGDFGCNVSSISVDGDGNVSVAGTCPAGQCVNIWASSDCDLTSVNPGNATFLGCVPIGITNLPFQPDSCYYAADNSGNVLAQTLTRTIPTLGEGALIVFLLLLTGAGVFMMRRKKQAV